MNILYLYSGPIIPERGGIRRVTQVLAGYFETKGHHVLFLAQGPAVVPPIARQFYLPEMNACDSPASVAYLRDFLVEHRIDVVINQNGLGGKMNLLAYEARRMGVPLVSAIHSTLLGGVRNARYAKADRMRRFGLQWLAPLLGFKPVNRMLVWAYKCRYRDHFRKLCEISDRVVLLSDRIKGELEEYVGLCSAKVVALPNPNSSTGTDHAIVGKQKRILWVGRVDDGKRLDLLLHAWRSIEAQHPDWSVIVVGDGPCLNLATAWVVAKKVRGVTFVGRTDALPFYRDASIFSFTSAYEGFGMVLVEAMASGCVPIAFNSFLAAEDIVDHEVNGVLVPAFDCDRYAQELGNLIADPERRLRLAASARQKAQRFDIEIIGAKWINLIESIRESGNAADSCSLRATHRSHDPISKRT